MSKKPDIVTELNGLHNSCCNRLRALGEPGLVILKPEIFSQIEDQQQVNALVDTLNSDLDKYTTELEELHNKHKKYGARLKRPNQFIEAFAVGNEYVDLIDRIELTTAPIATQLGEILEKNLLKEEEPNATAQ